LLLFIRENIGPLIALLGATIAWVALKANHDWNRRHCALQLGADWNENTAKHRRAIEDIFPGLIDKDTKAEYTTEITKELARKIYTSKPEKIEGSTDSAGIPNYWKARFHLIELGNHMECISIAYINKVADQKMIEHSFKAPMIRWHKIMINFISEVQEHRGYSPWEPWDTVVQQWEDKSKSKKRKSTA
jgi:hypothetical protein